MTFQVPLQNVQWVPCPMVQMVKPAAVPMGYGVHGGYPMMVQQVPMPISHQVQQVQQVPIQLVHPHPVLAKTTEQKEKPEKPAAAPVAAEPVVKKTHNFSYVDSNMTPLRVSGKTKASGLAGAIAKRLRMCQSVAVEAMGAESVATTTTALALAKTFISIANLSLLVQVESISAPSRSAREEADHPGLRFMVSATLEDSVTTYKHDATRKVPEGAQVAKIAGSISKMIRTTGTEGVICMGLEGSSSRLLNTSVKSIALSRAMLQENNLDIVFQPYFRTPDKRSSLVNITLLVVARKPGTTHTFLPSCTVSSEGSASDSEHETSSNSTGPSRCSLDVNVDEEDDDGPPLLLPTEDIIEGLNKYLENF
eukprot:TRINITY_DN3127_c0_g1_i4.p1 TRINITY_DN3127_c0_g1~~TRINITY_DN3127_c0_g1_i4.p1  ORF type:complete len:366 (+),score=75.75 TRINITY_DN3127_c0_g1_i4:56-1153(+)